MKKFKITSSMILMLIVAVLFVFIVTEIPSSPDAATALGSILLAVLMVAAEVALFVVGRKRDTEPPVHAVLWNDVRRERTEAVWAGLMRQGKLRFIVEYADGRHATVTLREGTDECEAMKKLLSRENMQELERIRASAQNK